jgi:hypothetical protein
MHLWYKIDTAESGKNELLRVPLSAAGIDPEIDCETVPPGRYQLRPA